MGRFPVLFQGIILSLCFTTGCALNVGSPVSWYKNRKVTEDSEKTKKKLRNPFAKKTDSKEEEKAVAKKDDKETKPKENSKEETKIVQASSETASEKSDDKKTDSDDKLKIVKHDAKTLLLIEEELKKHPPEEREKVYNELKALDSQVVKAVINIWQMTRQAEEQSPSHQMKNKNSQSASLPGDPQVPQQNPQPVFNPGQQTNGLGAASPWNNRTNNAPVQNQYNNQQNNQYPNQNIHASNTTGNQYNQIQPAHPSRAFGNVPPQGNYNSQLNNSQLNNQNVNQMNQPVNNQVYRPNGSLPVGPGNIPNYNMTQQNGLNQQPYNGVNQQQNNRGPFPAPQNQQQASVSSSVPQSQVPPQFPNNNKTQPAAQNGQAPLMPSQYSVPEYRTRAGLPQNSQWGDALQNLISQAEAEVSQIRVGQNEQEESYYIERQVYLRLLYLMSGQQNRALAVIPGINQQDQAFWTQVMWGLANYFDIENMPDKSNRATQTITQLRTAIQRLQGFANLELKNVNFCHDIENFGNYEKYDRDEFKRGQTVLVYVEVNNLEYQFTDNKYRSELHSKIEIYRAGNKEGLAAPKITFPATPDESNNIRKDYFLSYQLTIPEDLSIGPHTIKLTVEDKLGNKMATYSLNFTVK